MIRNGGRYRGYAGKDTGLPRQHGVMTFEEIGQELGITRGGAWMAYKSALRKLRKKRQAFEAMLAMARSKSRANL